MFQEHISPPTAVSLHKAVAGVRQHSLSVEKALNALFAQQKSISSAVVSLICL